MANNVITLGTKPHPHEHRGRGDWYVAAMERLIEVIQELSLARDMPALQEIVRTAARELTQADGATFILRDGEHCYYVDEDAIAPLWKGRRFPMDMCISGWVMQNKAPAVIPDIYQDPRIPADAYRPTFVRSLAVVPIRARDRLGAIGTYWARQRQPTERELHLLRVLADSTAVAIESVRIVSNLEGHVRERTRALEAANEEVRQLALVDELTGLHNRRGFFVLAEQAHKAALRMHKKVFVLFIDADGLKKVNDGLGHEAGDEMLRNLAHVLRATFRKSDIVARLGGDEFCVFGMHDDPDPPPPSIVSMPASPASMPHMPGLTGYLRARASSHSTPEKIAPWRMSSLARTRPCTQKRARAGAGPSPMCSSNWKHSLPTAFTRDHFAFLNPAVLTPGVARAWSRCWLGLRIGEYQCVAPHTRTSELPDIGWHQFGVCGIRSDPFTQRQRDRHTFFTCLKGLP